MFCDQLIRLRREKGYSQEQLANELRVSRQAVSKWESGATMPELDKLVALCDLFDVSLDSLVRKKMSERSADTPANVNAEVLAQLAEIRQSVRQHRGFEYKSKTLLCGIPLVHVNLSRANRHPSVAKGIIAIGDIAVGALSIGGLSVGLISIGGLSFGLLLALGGLSAGAVAAGGLAVGLYAFGGVAIAVELAMGGAAVGRVAVGDAVRGEFCYRVHSAQGSIEAFLRQYVPHFPAYLSRLFSVN